MGSSLSEFALLLVVLSLVLTGLLVQYAWLRRLVAIAIAAQVAQFLGGDAWAITALVAGVAIWLTAALTHLAEPSTGSTP